ncbi:class A beta-lactamase-related serine hydrolase [Eubacteriales bacterium OttesenSCG-928-G02]|nr:class A beta-lactamase-related serine hydrolase [Eubacteriales bacterium OttesenSCG-928-G02]
MRKLIAVVYLMCSILVCNVMNASLMTADKNIELEKLNNLNQIDSLDHVTNIPEDILTTDDPYVFYVNNDNGQDPAYQIKNPIVGDAILSSAKKSTLTGSNLVITDFGVSLQGNILNKIISETKFPNGQVVLNQGTGSKLTGDTTALNKLLNNKNSDISFMAVRLSDGASMGYNVDKYYRSCSTIKAPMALYASKLIAEGKLSSNSIVTYTANHYMSGSGLIKSSAYGTKYKMSTLIKYSLVESDNIAHNMLSSALNIRGFYNMLEDMNVVTAADDNTYWPQANARGAALWWNEIYTFAQSNSTGKNLWDTIGQAYSKINAALNKAKPVYGKTGSSISYYNGGYTVYSHEGAVVMGDKPYILIIYTKINSSSSNTDSYFYNIVKEIDKIMCK